jgi:hypothetical protein
MDESRTGFIEAFLGESNSIVLDILKDTLDYKKKKSPEVIQEIPKRGKLFILELLENWDVSDCYPLRIPGDE